MAPTIRRVLSGLAVSSALLSCSGGDAAKRGVGNNVVLPPVLVPTTVVVSGIALGQIGPMGVVGDLIWVGDNSGDPFLHVIDLRNRKILVSWGKQGTGPGDYQYVEAFATARTGEGRIIAIDENQSRLSELGLRPDLSPELVRSWKLPVSPRPRRVTALGSGYVGWTEANGAEWLRLDSTGTIYASVEGQLLGADSVPKWERHKASANMNVCANPDGSRFAVFYASAGRVELHSPDGALVGLAAVPSPSDAEFVRRKNGEMGWRKDKSHYLACTANSDVILGLYSGKVASQYDETAAQELAESRLVDVFDWDGGFLGQLQLGQPVVGMLLRTDSGLLLAASTNASTIYEMDISGALAKLRGRRPN